MNQLIWLIPFLPFAGFLINGIGFKRIPKNVVGIIGSGSVLLSFVLVAVIFFQNLNGQLSESFSVDYGKWIDAGNYSVSFSFLIDRLSILFMLVVTGVGFLIHVYSIGYMKEDEGYGKYFAYLNLFMFSMLVLVMGASYVMMFIGWEGVGLCSYLLIGFWFKKKEYTAAANKAFIMNRIGDLGFLVGIFMLFSTFGSSDYESVFASASHFSIGDSALLIICISLFIGAMGKSAQIPLYTWLPDAMAGPTPVSALIHAATMVTAGIYMIARSNILFSLAPVALEFITVIGAATAILAALIAITQTDIKKVLAYSTVSQLGYMFVALGLASYSTAVFHVMTHAFFKALLFLGSGSVIHAMSGEQNIRRMGGLKKWLPITHITFLIGCLAISGFPPFAGFFSKDEILASAWENNFPIFIILSITSVLTAAYMFRLYFMTFWGGFRGTHEQEHHLHESPKSMTFPLIVLAVLSSLGGFIGLPAIFGENNHVLKNYLAPVFQNNPSITDADAGSVFEIALMIISVILLALIIKLAFDRYAKKEVVKSLNEDTIPATYRWSMNKFYVDEMYEKLIVRPLEWCSHAFINYIEKPVIDGAVNGIGNFGIWIGSQLRIVQSGNIGLYIIMMVVGILALLIYSLIKLNIL